MARTRKCDLKILEVLEKCRGIGKRFGDFYDDLVKQDTKYSEVSIWKNLNFLLDKKIIWYYSNCYGLPALAKDGFYFMIFHHYGIVVSRTEQCDFRNRTAFNTHIIGDIGDREYWEVMLEARDRLVANGIASLIPDIDDKLPVETEPALPSGKTWKEILAFSLDYFIQKGIATKEELAKAGNMNITELDALLKWKQDEEQNKVKEDGQRHQR